jgi:hypothetical protein
MWKSLILASITFGLGVIVQEKLDIAGKAKGFIGKYVTPAKEEGDEVLDETTE